MEVYLIYLTISFNNSSNYSLVPHPPKNLSIEKVTSNTVVVHWEAPTDSIFTEYSIRYRTEDDPRWVKLPSVRDTEAEVADMTPGEKYTIQVNTVSYGVESLYPLQVNHTVSKYIVNYYIIFK